MYYLIIGGKPNSLLASSIIDIFGSANCLFSYVNAREKNHYLSALSKTLSTYDKITIISILPIWIQKKLFSSFSLHSSDLGKIRLILLSSQSVLTKNGDLSIDDYTYKGFIDGEQYFMNMQNLFRSLTIIRLPQVVESCNSPSIPFVNRFISKYNFFVVSSSANGGRSPISFKRLASSIAYISFSTRLYPNYISIVPHQTISAKDLILNSINSYPGSILFVIPHHLVKFIIRVVYPLRRQMPKSIVNLLGYLARQSVDLTVSAPLTSTFEVYNGISFVN